MSQGRHPRHDLDDVLSNGVRLSIVAALQGVERAEFALVRDSVEITDSALSKQCALLESIGYIEVTKGRVGRRPRTWLALTPAGRDALSGHMVALRAIADLPTAQAARN
jgi:DNA-binding HxlR family transcriptional regulator